MQFKEENQNNQSSLTHFLLLGITEVHELQILLFIVFFVYYLLAFGGNLLVIAAIAVDYHLHNPMHFFLMILAIQDVGQITVFIPKSMVNSIMGSRHILYSGCVAQVLLYVFFLASDFFLLTIMAYDRYVAICNPLQYEMLMNKEACLQMIVIVWIVSFLHGVLHTGCTFSAPFCSNIVNQFFCEIPELVKLACSNLNLFEVGFIVLSIVAAVGCFIFIIFTYVHIFATVLKIPSLQGRKKALSTCLPHLMVVSIFISTAFFTYIKPSFNSPLYLNLAMTTLYSMVPPLMNPVIYSMRNKGIKNAIAKILGLRYFSVNSV